MKYACFGFQITSEFFSKDLTEFKFFTTHSEFFARLFKSLQVLSKKDLSPIQFLQYLSTRIKNVNNYDEGKKTKHLEANNV